MRPMLEIINKLDILGANIMEVGPSLDVPGSWVIAVRIADIMVVASNGGGWDHVSVSLSYRTPIYDEMKAIKRLFFLDHEWAMELHAPVLNHVNVHQYCLHMWRPQSVAIPIPPQEMV